MTRTAAAANINNGTAVATALAAAARGGDDTGELFAAAGADSDYRAGAEVDSRRAGAIHSVCDDDDADEQ